MNPTADLSRARVVLQERATTASAASTDAALRDVAQALADAARELRQALDAATLSRALPGRTS